jgi:hypothetical protein
LQQKNEEKWRKVGERRIAEGGDKERFEHSKFELNFEREENEL